MEKKVLLMLTVSTLVVGLAILVNGQGNYGMYHGGGGGYPGGGGGYPGGGGGGWYPGGGGGGYPGGGGGYPGGGGGYPGGGGWYPGGGGGGHHGRCQCRRHCYPGERWAGRCHRGQWGGRHRRRLVRCCPRRPWTY